MSTATQFFLNVLFSSVAISACTWLAKRDPRLGGFIVSLPLSTMLVLAFTYIQERDAGKSTLLAQSIFLGLPLSLSFFVPFLLADRFRLTFWQSYVSGVVLILVSYLLHRALFAAVQ